MSILIRDQCFFVTIHLAAIHSYDTEGLIIQSKSLSDLHILRIRKP
jgi:hypothetical protein